MKEYLDAFRKFAQFSGRARRRDYWMFFLVNTFVNFIFTYLAQAAKAPALAGLYSLVVLLPAVAVAVRRMHDVGKSGWFILIPIYNFILAVTAGDAGPNEYGPDPKAGAQY